MQYEAKHNFFKIQHKSYKNITQTLAQKNYMAYNWSRKACATLEGIQLASKLNVSLETNVLSITWVKYQATEYRSDLVMCGEVTCQYFTKTNLLLLKMNMP